MPRSKRTITAQDLYRMELILSPRISPDGETIVYGLQTIDRKTEKKQTNLWLAAAAGGRPRQFTYGNKDLSPEWSPDGSQIAFLSERGEDELAELYVIPLGGGEARQLTRLQAEIGSFSWAPDGKRILCSVRKRDAEEIARQKDEQKKKLGTVARHYRRVFFKQDAEGYLPQERWHLWVINAQTGRGKQLTDGDLFDESVAAWSPDGDRIAFISNRSPDPDMDPDADDIFLISAEGGKPERLELPAGPKFDLSFSPDGKTLAYFAIEGKGQWYRNVDLWTVPLDNAARARSLFTEFDLTIADGTLNDIGGMDVRPPVWSPDGERIFFQIDRHGRTPLMSIRADGEDMLTEIGSDGCVASYSFDQAHTRLAYFFPTMQHPGQIYLQDRRTGRTRSLTRHNSWIRRIDLGEVEQVWFSPSGGHLLHGWILKPPGFDPRKKYPSILEIHGGPLLQYGHYFMHEFHYLAAQGYVVYFSNPRGGLGYGEEHAKAIWGAWGTKDYEDLMAWSDNIAERPFIDRDRMGVTGGSYGGYMTCWILGHTDRFGAAVIQRCVSNFISMWGSSDYNWIFQQVINNKAPFEDLANAWDRSPLKYIANVKTPALVIHSEDDFRTPIEQGEQVFVALKRLGIDTEFVRFPGESHGMSRQGRTDRRIVRLEHILRWMNKYLK